MKGVVFTEFLEMVENSFGYEVVDQLLTENELPSGGIYTSVGTYAYSEMGQLLHSLSEKTNQSIPHLLKKFGRYLFGTFQKGYPQFLVSANTAFDFLESIEKHIHVEVRKLYPDAELPKFKTTLVDEHTLQMIYYSERRMGDFAEGLIESSLVYYEEQATIMKKNLKEDGSEVEFLIRKNTKG